ncbi:MAG: UvrD-helicase domain-containing protein [Syntrophobacterales bacterium]|nr:UvrD-helicase domain-containing protein [Syntrophobacterales bacterium]
MTFGKVKDNNRLSPVKNIDANEFAVFSDMHLELWSKIEGANIHHSTYGAGQIIRVEQRTDYIPLIDVRFEKDNKEKTFNSESFKSGIIETIQISEIQDKILQNWKNHHILDNRQNDIDVPKNLANLNEEQRNALLWEVRQRLQSDFLGVDSFFQKSCAGFITEQEFEAEKLSFVKSWVTANTPSAKDSVKQIPDDEQLAAIASVHGHIQVIARAGSGKTATLVNRTLFLLKHCGVPPSEMLILAFNRKAVLEVRRRLVAFLSVGANAAIEADIDRRIRESGKRKRFDRGKFEVSAVDAIAKRFNITLPHVMTFHALAYAIVHPEESPLYDDDAGEDQGLSRAVQQLLDDHLQIPTFRDQIRELMLAHFREDWDRIVEGRYDQSKEEFLRFRRSLTRESIGGEYVKSYGEKVVADFLFEHNISYKYERNFFWSGKNYRPDFTIFKTSNSGVIIEYFGLKGDVDYDEMSETKRKYWDGNKDWTLIEFYPNELAKNGVTSFLDLLKSRIEKQGIQCVRLSEDEIWHRIRDRAIDRFTTASRGFIGRCRKQSLSSSELRKRIEVYLPISPVEVMFLNLACQLYGAYLDRLTATGEDDFDGLMQRATEAIRSGQTVFQRKLESGDIAALRYICIDEFQDFSDLFYRLLGALREKNQKVELFCVGDDWQAINGFAGSDLRFFENFEEHIGKSRQLYISTNYRSPSAIVAVGNALMNGLGKPAVAYRKSVGKVLVSDINEFKPSPIEKERHPGDILTPVVSRLANKALVDGKDVVMLCRRNGLPWFVNYQDQAGNDGRGLDRYLGLVRSFFSQGLKERISISTTHKYKGLEKPVVIVLDAVARSYPLIHPNWVFSRIFGDSPDKIAKEERRLLYVALTRAVDTLIIITDGRSKSPFLEELECIQPLCKINWADYPPLRGIKIRLVVKVGNQDSRGGSPTFAIKAQLQASGYQWRPTGWPGWTKSFPVEGFNLENLKSEVWAASADGIEVRIFEDTDKLAAKYLVVKGQWQCEADHLATLHDTAQSMEASQNG